MQITVNGTAQELKDYWALQSRSDIDAAGSTHGIDQHHGIEFVAKAVGPYSKKDASSEVGTLALNYEVKVGSDMLWNIHNSWVSFYLTSELTNDQIETITHEIAGQDAFSIVNNRVAVGLVLGTPYEIAKRQVDTSTVENLLGEGGVVVSWYLNDPAYAVISSNLKFEVISSANGSWDVSGLRDGVILVNEPEARNEETKSLADELAELEAQRKAESGSN